MPFDDVAWAHSDSVAQSWLDKIHQHDTLLEIAKFIQKHRGGIGVRLWDPQLGGFNVTYRMEFMDGGSAIIRFPLPGVSMFPEEKIQNEVAVMKYIHEHTSIPVPFILHWGNRDESPC